MANENNYFSIVYEGNENEKVFYTYQKGVTFNRFSEGKHRFYVQGYNQDGSDANRLHFVVKVRGPYWRQWWFYTILAGLLITGVVIFFRTREKRLKDKYALKQEINQLEKSALQAQMNPHFIFNCLNSIQSFIMKNDKENAMEYLGSFARLIRANLNASLSKLISIEEEVRILENYLKLEKLRLNDAFEYTISQSSEVSATDIFIPPMLIQPFVENAVIHGMHNKNKEGKILIEFKLEGDNLLVSVNDNGDPSKKNPSPLKHKSVGVAITTKRLEHINNSSSDTFNVNIDHTPEGTQVSIRIRYSTSSEGLSV